MFPFLHAVPSAPTQIDSLVYHVLRTNITLSGLCIVIHLALLALK